MNTYDEVHNMDTSYSCFDLSSSEPDEYIVMLNLDISVKNKLLLEQQSNLSQSDDLVDRWMRQIQRFKLEEKKLKSELTQSRRVIAELKSDRNRLVPEQIKPYQTRTKHSEMSLFEPRMKCRENMSNANNERSRKYGSYKNQPNKKYKSKLSFKNDRASLPGRFDPVIPESFLCHPPPPPPPTVPPRRLVTVVKDRASRSSFCQLDGEASEIKEVRKKANVKRPMRCMICCNTYQSILSDQGGARRAHEGVCIEMATVTYL